MPNAIGRGESLVPGRCLLQKRLDATLMVGKKTAHPTCFARDLSRFKLVVVVDK